jgi:hypothetical protein
VQSTTCPSRSTVGLVNAGYRTFKSKYCRLSSYAVSSEHFPVWELLSPHGDIEPRLLVPNWDAYSIFEMIVPDQTPLWFW